MKKLYLIIFLSLILLFLNSGQILAADCGKGGDPQATGLVPCGVSCDCTIDNFFTMLVRIYNFIVFYIATPLAVLAIVIGAIFLMAAAGNPQLASKGKQIIYTAIIGLVLVFCSFLIINFIMTTLGYKLGGGNWWQV
jgi:hypothetical protein